MLPGMKRLVVLALTVAVLAAACGEGNAVEATVNGEEITTRDVEGLLYEPTDADRAPDQFAVYLGLLIQWAAIDDRVDAELGFVPAEEDVDAEVRRIVLNAGFGDLPTFLLQQNISESALRRIAAQVLVEQHLHDLFVEPIEEATADEAQAAMDETPWYSEICASHILVGTVDEAAAAMARFQGGESFGDLAAELSLDTGNSLTAGSLGCEDPRNYVEEFADAIAVAPLREVAGPVQTEFGWHLILVESRTPATVEFVQQALSEERQVEADRAAVDIVGLWLDEAVRSATVTVNEDRGTWVTDPQPQVVPPAVLE